MSKFIKILIGTTVITLISSSVQVLKVYGENSNYNSQDIKIENEMNLKDDRREVYTDSRLTAKEISLNGKYKYKIEKYDNDYWVKFKVPEQGYITIRHQKTDIAHPVDFYLKASDGSTIKHIHPEYIKPELNEYEYKAGLKAGQYYLNFNLIPRYGWNENSNIYMDYSVEFKPTKNFEIENNDTKEKATLIELNKSIGGYTDKNDISPYRDNKDWYKIYLEKDKNVRFKISNEFENIEIHMNNSYINKFSYSDYLGIDEDGNIYKDLNLKKGMNYLLVNNIKGRDYKIEIEEIPDTPPILTVSDKVFSTDKHISNSDLLEGIKAYDNEDGDLTHKIRIMENEVQSYKPGIYKVVYEVEDKDGNKVRKEIRVTIKNSILYQTHVQDYGWQDWKADGQMSGTEGQAKRLEGIRINISDMIPGASIKYRTHIQDYGWQDWKYNGEMSGTEGQAKRLEGIEIKLENAPGYSVEYRTHVQDYGWQDWKRNGEMSGTEGQAKRLEGIEIRIVKNK